MNRVDKINYYLDMAEVALERATCLRKKWGAVIVKMMKLSQQDTMELQEEERTVLI